MYRTLVALSLFACTASAPEVDGGSKTGASPNADRLFSDNAEVVLDCTEASGLPTAMASGSRYRTFMRRSDGALTFDVLADDAQFAVAQVSFDTDVIHLPYAGEIARMSWLVMRADARVSQMWYPDRSDSLPFPLGAIELSYPTRTPTRTPTTGPGMSPCTPSFHTSHGVLTLSECTCAPLEAILRALTLSA